MYLFKNLFNFTSVYIYHSTFRASATAGARAPPSVQTTQSGTTFQRDRARSTPIYFQFGSKGSQEMRSNDSTVVSRLNVRQAY